MRSETAIALATAVTLIVCVSRLCTTCPAAPCVITWVTAASREKYGENRIRSRSSRNAGLLSRTGSSNPPGTLGSPRRANRGST